MRISIKYARQPGGGVFYYQHWVPDAPRALAVFVHGLGDHIGRYQRLVEAFAAQGIATALFDQRGHGRSDGARGHAERFADWVNDLAGFVQFSLAAVPPVTPLFIVGFGLGALVGINFIVTHTTPVDGVVAVSAAISPRCRRPAWRTALSRRMARLFPAMPVRAGFSVSDLTDDPEERALLDGDPLFHTRTTLASSLEIDRGIELAMALPHRIHLPTLVVAGELDAIYDPAGARMFASRLASLDKAFVSCESMPHDLLHGPGSAAVIDRIARWIAERAEGAPRPDAQYRLTRKEMLWEDVSP